MNEVPNFRYRALTQNGEIVNGTISAPTSAEVARRIEYLRLLPIETVEDSRAGLEHGSYGWFGRPTAAEITTFTRDLALLLKAGADPDSPNAEGQTGLMAVARTGNVEALVRANGSPYFRARIRLGDRSRERVDVPPHVRCASGPPDGS